jgi:hypothetical protein
MSGASLDDVVTKQAAMISQLSAIYSALIGIFRNTGTFTMGAAATTVVTNAGIQANSQIILIPTNAAAGTLIGSTKSPYVSARSVGTSFTVATASGVAAAGSEQFFYVVVTPV